MAPAPDLEELIRLARSGMPDDLGRLMDTCRTYLTLVAQNEMDRSIASKEGASDIVQDTFLLAQKNFDQFTGTSEAQFKRWLIRILQRHLARRRRHLKKVQKRTVDREVRLDTVVDMETREIALASREPQPSDAMILAEQNELLQAALGRLPQTYRQVVLYRHRDGMDFEQIAQQLGQSREAVRQRWVRGLEMLRRYVDAVR